MGDPLTPLTPCAPLLTPWTPRSTPSTSRGSSLNSAAFPSVGKLHYPGKDFIPNSYRLHTGLSPSPALPSLAPPSPFTRVRALRLCPLPPSSFVAPLYSLGLRVLDSSVLCY